MRGRPACRSRETSKNRLLLGGGREHEEQTDVQSEEAAWRRALVLFPRRASKKAPWHRARTPPTYTHRFFFPVRVSSQRLLD